MAKAPKKPKPEEIETEPDGWDRFTKAVKRMAPPKPKKADQVKKSKRKQGKRKSGSTSLGR